MPQGFVDGLGAVQESATAVFDFFKYYADAAKYFFTFISE